MKANMMGVGGALLTLGVTMIAAAPEMFLSYGPNPGSVNATAIMALFGIVFATLGGGYLAYGVGAKSNQ